jgi:sarcosine oxidase subunit alpha
VRRLIAVRDPVTIYLDGKAVVAERGEPAAIALLAAGRVALARSPKFHRPRGPACLRSACDGCLARVDGVPNVTLCRVPATDGMRIETQNVVGSRDTDLLRMTDWFFPKGMDHHELFAGIPGGARVMQALARRVAGLGKLPAHEARRRPARRRQADVLVVGAGPAGVAAALELSRRGRKVEVVDDDIAVGGSLQAMAGPARDAWILLLRSLDEALTHGQVRVRTRTTAAGIYGDDVLLVGSTAAAADRDDPGPIEVLQARTLVLAPGAHDGVMAFEGNDVPGVMSARAGCRLLAAGVRQGSRVVVVTAPGGGPFGSIYARAQAEAKRFEGIPVRVRGSARVREATVATAGGEVRVRCDALLVDAPVAPAYELCAQAGASLEHEPRGFVVRVGPGGRIREGVFAVGEAVGTPLDPARVVAEAKALTV